MMTELPLVTDLQNMRGYAGETELRNDKLLTTLTGGLVVLGLFHRQWGVTRCIQTFDSLTREFFSTRLRVGGGPWQFFRHLLRC